MKKVSKILVPLDGSKNSVRGLEMAITLARQCGAALTGAYSVNTRSRSEFGGARSVEKEVGDEVKKILGEARALAEKHGVRFSEKMMRGDVGYNIVKLAQGKDNFDMIVMGSRGRSSAKQMFFGSTSNYVIHASKIPVVVVK